MFPQLKRKIIKGLVAIDMLYFFFKNILLIRKFHLPPDN